MAGHTESNPEKIISPAPSIGRITEGLLLDGIARQVDVIEPIAKFTAALQGKPGVRTVFTMGLEDWQPSPDVQYDLIWIQWCVAHLTDEQLVRFLERCKSALNPDDGLIVVKENNSTSGADEFDDLDSSVTRYAALYCVPSLFCKGKN
jgi:protein N-terminal methyltransferase